MYKGRPTRIEMTTSITNSAPNRQGKIGGTRAYLSQFDHLSMFNVSLLAPGGNGIYNGTGSIPWRRGYQL